jgi:hypothetical protein
MPDLVLMFVGILSELIPEWGMARVSFWLPPSWVSLVNRGHKLSATSSGLNQSFIFHVYSRVG